MPSSLTLHKTVACTQREKRTTERPDQCIRLNIQMVKYNVLESLKWCTANWKGTSLPIMQSLISQHPSQCGYAPGNSVGMVTAGSMTFFFPVSSHMNFLFTSGSSKFRLIALLIWGKKEKRACFWKHTQSCMREKQQHSLGFKTKQLQQSKNSHNKKPLQHKHHNQSTRKQNKTNPKTTQTKQKKKSMRKSYTWLYFYKQCQERTWMKNHVNLTRVTLRTEFSLWCLHYHRITDVSLKSRRVVRIRKTI